MKIMSRDFTTTEKIILVVLVLILLGLVYYRFVDRVVRQTIANNEAEASMLQTELDGVQQRLMQLQSVQSSMDDLEAAGELSWMGSYNNEREEVVFLNDILADTLRYSIAFSNVTRTGNQIRRNFTLQYTTTDYRAAQDIVLKLCNGRNRCVVGDMQCRYDGNRNVNISCAATFYETMVEGTPDAALPQSSAAVNQ